MLFNFVKQISEGNFSGGIIGIDQVLPPIIVPFSFGFKDWDDSFSASFKHISQPGGRWQYPVNTGYSPRVITFKTEYDEDYSVGRPDSKKTPDFANAIRGITTYVASTIATYEMLKTPRNTFMRSTVDSIGRVFFNSKISYPANHSYPPLCVLIKGMQMVYLGYFSDVKIRELRYNEFMVPTRVEIQPTFNVFPDAVFSSLDDGLRSAKSLVGAFM